MTLLAAFQTLLHRYTSQDDIAIGCPIAGRNRPEVENLIGFFLNILVFRATLPANQAFSNFWNRVRPVCLSAYAHQDLPFEKLVEELHPERRLNRSPLVDVTFAFQNTPRVAPRFPAPQSPRSTSTAVFRDSIYNSFWKKSVASCAVIFPTIRICSTIRQSFG